MAEEPREQIEPNHPKPSSRKKSQLPLPNRHRSQPAAERRGVFVSPSIVDEPEDEKKRRMAWIRHYIKRGDVQKLSTWGGMANLCPLLQWLSQRMTPWSRPSLKSA